MAGIAGFGARASKYGVGYADVLLLTRSGGFATDDLWPEDGILVPVFDYFFILSLPMVLFL